MLPTSAAGRLVYGVVAVLVFAVAVWNLVSGQPQDPSQQSGAWPAPLQFAVTVAIGLAVLFVALTIPDRE